MGDKGGKKDKAKNEQQKVKRLEHVAQEKLTKSRPKVQ